MQDYLCCGMISVLKGLQMASHEVTVTRVRFSHTVFQIEADSPEEAQRQAEELVEVGPHGPGGYQLGVSTEAGALWRWRSHTRDGVYGRDEYAVEETS